MASRRTLVLVAGSGRSGASVLAGALQRLGFRVPSPEVAANDANPRGVGESQWVVDFHNELLERAKVQVADSRPAAWAHTAEVGFDRDVQHRLREWMAAEFKRSDDLVIKDPRLSWFVPLWRRCGESLDAPPRFVNVLRHPAAVIEKAQGSYVAWRSDVSRAAGWINHTLFTERATRDAPRVFVRYDELAEDWTKAVGHVGEALDLSVVRDAQVPAMRRAHEYVDGSLSSSRADWSTLKIPATLREQAGEVWELASELAAGREVLDRLDAARAAYIAFYDEVEAIAQSSIEASRTRNAPNGQLPVPGVMRRVPAGLRHRVPLRWRKRVVRALASR
jgi:hypothetical protein